MNRLHKFRNRKAAIVKEMESILATAAEEDRPDLNEQEQERYAGFEKELTSVSAAIEREERLQQHENALRAMPVDEPKPEPVEEKPKKFGSLGAMLQAVAASTNPRGYVDERLRIGALPSGLGETVDSAGGFLVQQDFSAELLSAVYESGQLASRCSRTPISANSNGLKMLGIDETSRADGSQWGGVTAYWESEADSTTATKPKFRKIELSLKKMMGLCYATEELLQDATALESIVRDSFTNVFAWKLDNAILRGTGAGQPLGVLNSGATVSIAKEAGQAAATIVAENIEKMYARMWARGLNNAVWLINQDCWPQLFKLHHAVGTGGVPMFIPAGGLTQSPAGTLLGRPIVPIEQCSTLGTVGDIVFADLSQYKLIDKGGIQSASSIHVRFLNDETTFRFILRTDGQPTWYTYLTPANGSNYISPFITLATRS